MKEGPDHSRRTSREKVRDETDAEQLGPYVRRLHLQAQVEHMKDKPKDA